MWILFGVVTKLDLGFSRLSSSLNFILLFQRGHCWGQKWLFRIQRLWLFLIHRFLVKHSLKERSEVKELANPAQKPLAGELNRRVVVSAGEFGRHAGQLARRARPDPGLSDLLRLPYLPYSCVIQPSGPYTSRFVLIKVILEVLWPKPRNRINAKRPKNGPQGSKLV